MDFKDRLLEEQKELQDRIDKLKKFLFEINSHKGVTAIQQTLLHVQLSSMNVYNTCLLERIKDLGV